MPSACLSIHLRAAAPWQDGQWRLPQDFQTACTWPQPVHLYATPPSAGVRQRSMQSMTFSAMASSVPAMRARNPCPARRKTSATPGPSRPTGQTAAAKAATGWSSLRNMAPVVRA